MPNQSPAPTQVEPDAVKRSRYTFHLDDSIHYRLKLDAARDRISMRSKLEKILDHALTPVAAVPIITED